MGVEMGVGHGGVCVCSTSVNWSRLSETLCGTKTAFVHHVKFHVQYRIDAKTHRNGKLSVWERGLSW